MSLKDDFRVRHLPTLWDKIQYWFLFRKVKRLKKLLLWEAYMDKMFFETELKEFLEYDETKDRATLAEENKKPFEKQDRIKLYDLEEKISKSKAIKNAYRQSANLRAELGQYLHMLDIWKNQE